MLNFRKRKPEELPDHHVCPVCYEKQYAPRTLLHEHDDVEIHQCRKVVCEALFIIGKLGFSAAIVQHSRAWHGQDIITFRCRYPRFFHSELKTHRMISGNSASSRAIPVKRMMALIRQEPATFVHWGKNQGGMQAKEEVTGWRLKAGQFIWNKLDPLLACASAGILNWLGFHKQIVNRRLEAWQFMETILTATDFDNLLWLRDHDDAQPEFHYLAHLMAILRKYSEPSEMLDHDEWHVPYVARTRRDGKLNYWIRHPNGNTISLTPEEAKNVSASCVAQVSYMRLDGTLEKADKVVSRLMGTLPVHASPFEAQATPMSEAEWGIRNRVSIFYRDFITVPEQQLYCGNLRGWVQNRKYIPNENLNSPYKKD